jgi:O-antigen/teichoic acid export membrane protein
MLTAAVSSLVRRRWRLRPLFRDLGLTFATQIVTFLAGVGVITIFGRLLGAALLAEYLLIRRVAAWLSGAQLGLGVSLPRYVAYASGDLKRKPELYFVAAAACLGVFTAALLLPFNLLPTTFGRLFFGDPRLKDLIPPLSIFFLGLMAHGVVYGYYRGVLRMGVANALQCWNLAAVPLLSLGALFHTHSVGLIVSAMGALTILGSLLFAVPILRLFHPGQLRIREHAVELLNYGLRRVPGDFSGGALFALGPIIAAQYVPMDKVSYLLLGISILTAVSVSTGPLGLILLSKVSMMLAQNRREEVRLHVKHLLATVVAFSAFVTIQVVVFSDVLVRAWMGSTFSGHALIIRIVLLATPFYLLTVAFRSVIDAGSFKAYVTRNGLISLGVFLVLAGLESVVLPGHLLLEGIAGALLLALIALAWLTQLTLRQLFQVSFPWRSSLPSVALSLLLGGIALLIHWSRGFRTDILELLIIETVFSLLFVGALIRQDPPWLQFLWRTVFLRIAHVGAEEPVAG